MAKALSEVFRENIRIRRTELGLSTTEVAQRMGISQPGYTAYETGSRVPGIEVIEKISRALDVPAASLFMAREPAAA